MIKLLFVAVSLWTTMGFFPPEGLDFENKVLQKELMKASGTENPEWKELALPQNISETGRGKFFELSGAQAARKYIYVGRVNSCRQGGCSNPGQPNLTGTSEYFDYLIVFEPNLRVSLVKVYNYQATHGQEVTNKGWLKQFSGYDGTRSFTVGKNIDAIAGATVSVYAITSDIQEKTRLLQKMVGSAH